MTSAFEWSPACLHSLRQRGPELDLIESFYGRQRARRSGELLIKHIYEGLSILDKLSAPESAQRAFCLHPLLQNDFDLKNNFSRVSESLREVPEGSKVLAFAMEYRSVANEYLAHKPLPKAGVRLSPLTEVNLMLIADKLQNQRDFLFYHQGWHPNSARLTAYFEDWVAALLSGASAQQIAVLMQELPEQRRVWLSPLARTLIPTSDPESFSRMNPGTTGLPTGAHPGAFGFERTHHVHEGVDLYCDQGEPVYAVEPGKVVAVMPFTGPKAGLPWWLDTQVVLVEGPSGVVAYGEITTDQVVGASVQAGDRIGWAERVLRNDKGRPTTMLHLELHTPGTTVCPEWLALHRKPPSLRDPTPYLQECARQQASDSATASC